MSSVDGSTDSTVYMITGMSPTLYLYLRLAFKTYKKTCFQTANSRRCKVKVWFFMPMPTHRQMGPRCTATLLEMIQHYGWHFMNWNKIKLTWCASIKYRKVMSCISGPNRLRAQYPRTSTLILKPHDHKVHHFVKKLYYSSKSRTTVETFSRHQLKLVFDIVICMLELH